MRTVDGSRVLVPRSMLAAAACLLAASCVVPRDNPSSGGAAGAARGSSTARNDAHSTDTYVGPNDEKFVRWSVRHTNSIATVTGTVENLFSAKTFTLAGRDGAPELLVVVKGNVGNLRRGDHVAVTGAVDDDFDRLDLERKFDLDVDGSALEGYTGNRYIQASNTALVPAESTTSMAGAPTR